MQIQMFKIKFKLKFCSDLMIESITSHQVKLSRPNGRSNLNFSKTPLEARTFQKHAWKLGTLTNISPRLRPKPLLHTVARWITSLRRLWHKP